MLTWIKSLVREWRRKSPVNEKTEANKYDQKMTEAEAAKYFSTHRLREGKNATQLYIEQNAIPVKPDFTCVEGVAMDSVSEGLNNAKNAFALGQQILPPDLFAWYVSHTFIGYQACAIIAQQWLVDKACTVKQRDAMRNGFQITINDGNDIDSEVISAITKADKRYQLKKNLVRAGKFNNVFGIRHVLFRVKSDDPLYYEKPFNPKGIQPGSYQGISQIDPHWITPLLDSAAVAEPESIHFYEPTFWVISGKKYHRSHFHILRGPEVSDILKPTYIYGGLPLSQRIFERVYASERTANEAPILAMTKRLNVRKMDIEKAVANQDLFEDALAVQARYRDNHGILTIGLEEEAQQLETALTDFDTVVMSQYQLVSAESNTPATKLLGTSPKGFNATGEHEIATYHEELESIQENDYTPIIEKHHLCVMYSEIAPKFGQVFDIDIEWNPLAVLSALEEAQVQETKARTDNIHLTSGTIDQVEARDRLIEDKASGYNGLESLAELFTNKPLPLDETPGKEMTDEPGLSPLPLDRAAAANTVIKTPKFGQD